MNLLVSALVPIITEFIRGYIAEKGTAPTDAEVLQFLSSDEDAVLAVSDAWLATHPVGDRNV